MILEEYNEELHIQNEKRISFNEGKKEGYEQGHQEALRECILAFRSHGFSTDAIVDTLQHSFHLSKEEALKCVEQYPG